MGLFRSTVYEGEIRALSVCLWKPPIETFEDTGQIFLKNATAPQNSRRRISPGSLRNREPMHSNSSIRETCNCGCTLTLAQCRINDTSCPISKALAAKVVAEISGKPPARPVDEAAAPDPAPKQTPKPN